jgi:Family of unknown function (DUF6299)
MRVRLAVVCAIGALAALVVGPVPSASADGENAVTVAPTGTVAKDGTVTLSGTYRCSPDAAYGTVVNGSITDGQETSSVGGSVPATCDGYEHTWTAQGRPYLPAPAGPVRAEAALVHLTWQSSSLVPQVDVLADQPQDTVLVPERPHS